jgi:hypothetical protein
MTNPYYVQPIQPVTPSYNAVKIDVHNPSVNAPGAPQPQYYQPQYAPVTAPMYQYSQAVPQPVAAPAPAPAISPETANAFATYYDGKLAERDAAAQAMAAAAGVPKPYVPTPQVVQQNYNAPTAPQPVVTQPVAPAVAAPAAPTAEPQKPEIVLPKPMATQLDLNAFMARLNNPDFEVQANTMEEIANMVKEKPGAATELLDEKVIESLTGIITKDSTKLAGPTPEQVAARQKLMNKKPLSEAEQQLAMSITPMEQAERNKSYAMFTTAILQKLYNDEVNKLTGNTVPLTELPGAVTIVEALKDNDNPMVRTSAIEALSYIQNPVYKQDLGTLFTVAQNDSDRNVREAAKVALEKLNK